MAHRGHTERLVVAFVAAVLLINTIPTPAAAAATAAVPLGMDAGSVAELSRLGAPASYASFWVGHWMASSGWGGLDSALATAKSTGTTPLLYWYYWGDSISPSCVQNGCGGMSRSQWDSMTQTLVDHVKANMGGAPVFIVLENEFNKNGVDSSGYAPTFDALLETKIATLHSAPGVRVVLGFGGWGMGNWGLFPKSIASSDAIGFQAMRASTHDSEASYRGVADAIAQSIANAQRVGGKGAFLYDFAISSYPDAFWENVQGQTMADIISRLPSYAASGLQGIIYRELHDNPGMSPANYYGYAEQHWGLISTSGQKAAWKAWASAYTATAPPPPPPPPANRAPFASFTTSGANLSWSVDASSSSDPDANPITYAWNFGDGATATGVKATHSYANGGTFTVTLNVSDGQLSSTATRTITATTPPAPAPATAFSASFTPTNGNEWWIQTGVNANQPLSSVCVSINGGACQPLKLQSWGAWAASYNAKTGSLVRFTATSTSGQSVTSGAYNWPNGTAATGTVAPASAPPPAPAPSAFTATFSPYGGNAWWVQTKVSASQSVASMCATVNGGACQPLKYQSWGAWAASFNAPSGSKVVFKATSSTGAVATSATYTWPVS